MTQIESPAGVAIVDELMALDGIDVLFVGPNDLTQSMGIMDRPTIRSSSRPWTRSSLPRRRPGSTPASI
jgi:2-keto-3-deoxy-L-rhamnonate aldolase RhmA